MPSETRWERFLSGFLIGVITGVFGCLWSPHHFKTTLVVGLTVGLIVGGLGALFGKRFFNFLMEFLGRFGG
jgi:hypothetical protein